VTFGLAFPPIDLDINLDANSPEWRWARSTALNLIAAAQEARANELAAVLTSALNEGEEGTHRLAALIYQQAHIGAALAALISQQATEFLDVETDTLTLLATVERVVEEIEPGPDS
jgi:hypothetical protein